MNDACSVRGAEGTSHLDGVFERLRDAKTALRDEIGERLSGDILHNHKLCLALGDYVVNDDDVGVVQPGSGLRFLNETAPALRFGRAIAG